MPAASTQQLHKGTALIIIEGRGLHCSVKQGELNCTERILHSGLCFCRLLYLKESHSQPMALNADCSLGTLVVKMPTARASKASIITHLTQGSNSCAVQRAV